MVAIAAHQTERRNAKPRESWEHAIWRLAGEAQEAGIKLYHSGCMWFATSQSDPELLHRVTLVSCDCPGFAHHQRCKHLAALLQHTGNLPPRPAGFVHRVRCPRCWGDGMIGQLDKWCATCPECGGTGEVDEA